MKNTLIFVWILLFSHTLKAQTDQFNYAVSLNPITIANLPGLHSFVVAQSGGKFLVMGGRLDGLHARQPFNAFGATNNNTNIFVVDVNNAQFWTASVNTLPTNLNEQLQSTNLNFYQDADTLYIVGGYGYSQTAADHLTFPHLTTVSISGLINAIINDTPINNHFKQITNDVFAVTGGHLGKIGNTFYLIGGHRFDGRYNPMGHPTYTQTYVDGIRKFTINNSGSQLSYANYTSITDEVHLHRRDYNLLPQIFPDGTEGYTLSSGVFQPTIDLPFLYPVDITASGYQPITSFNQYLSNYHSANVCLYDSTHNQMNTLFFGGISQYYYNNGTLIQDNNVPFVKTISRLSRYSDGSLQEHLLPTEMPTLTGASAEFILNEEIPHYPSGIIKTSQITADSIKIGYIYGGINSSELNPFTVNNTGVTSASSVIYEVWLVKNPNTSVQTLDGSNPFQADVYPNPASNLLNATLTIPYTANLNLLITNANGKIVWQKEYQNLSKGKQQLELPNNKTLSSGIYFFNFVFDGKYAAIKKVALN